MKVTVGAKTTCSPTSRYTSAVRLALSTSVVLPALEEYFVDSDTEGAVTVGLLSLVKISWSSSWMVFGVTPSALKRLMVL